jgi:hypothetical protein
MITGASSSASRDKVATAHREAGESVSSAERVAIEEIAASLGSEAP